MINGLLGKKIGMTQIFEETGRVIPVTVIEAGPCVVLQVKSLNRDGYNALKIGFDEKKEVHTNKPQMGLFKKAGSKPLRAIKELRMKEAVDIKPAASIAVDIFEVGEYVDITGDSIGKGFQGGVKRWHWKGGPKSHGSMQHRAPGSIGASSDPSRVYKGQHLPGHMGSRKTTIQGLEIAEIDKDNNLLLVKGAVPGSKGSYIVINRSFKKKKKEPRPKDVAQEGKKINPLKQSKKKAKGRA